MSARFAELLQGLQDEHEMQVAEVTRLRLELAKQRLLAAKNQSLKRESRVVPHKKHAKAANASQVKLKKQGTKTKKAVDLQSVRSELEKQIGAVLMLDDASGHSISIRERIFYRVENLSSMFENLFFYILVVITVLATLILGIFWKVAAEEDYGTHSSFYVYYDIFQVISTQSINADIRTTMKTVVFTLAIAVGLVIFGILIGIISDKFQGLMTQINEGRSRVPESHHTLLLGWNESTERVVCQIACLRRQYIMANSTFMKRMFWWMRTPAATPIAKARIVILCNNKTKVEMHEAIERAFEDRGISPKRTRVGWDVICRVGDPTSPQDLMMVGAHRAVAIAVMMTQQDLDEEAGGGSANAATFRTVLALRKVLFDPQNHPPWSDLRVIVPLSRPSKSINSVAFSAPTEEEVSREVVLCQDLSLFLNTLIFTCSTQPGLADVFMELINFDGVALRLRKVKDFPTEHLRQPIVGKTFAEMSHRWENAILVGVVPYELMDAEVFDPHNGMAPNRQRVIKEDDRLVFVSANSLPLDAAEMPPRSSIGKKSAYVAQEKSAMKILVCGFRSTWKDPERFAYRLGETGKPLPDDSELYFLNQMPTPSFLDLMGRVCQHGDVVKVDETSSTWMLSDRIKLSFTEGDPSHFDTLEAVMIENHGFDVVIVVPPVDSTMSAQAQDTRLMTIMCTLRTICEDNDLPTIHVIGENKLESSSQLALRPKREETIDDTDFVNVQAIIARVLCQAMAFPFLQPAVVQLFSSAEGSPCIFLTPATLFVPLHTSIYFSDLIDQVKLESEDAIPIGYRITISGQLKQVLCPKLDDKCSFCERDVVIVIARKEPGATSDSTRSVSELASSEKVQKAAGNTLGTVLASSGKSQKATENALDPQTVGAAIHLVSERSEDKGQGGTESDEKGMVSPDETKSKKVAKVKRRIRAQKSQNESAEASTSFFEHDDQDPLFEPDQGDQPQTPLI